MSSADGVLDLRKVNNCFGALLEIKSVKSKRFLCMGYKLISSLLRTLQTNKLNHALDGRKKAKNITLIRFESNQTGSITLTKLELINFFYWFNIKAD